MVRVAGASVIMGVFRVFAFAAIAFSYVSCLVYSKDIIKTYNGYVKGKLEYLPRGKEVTSYLGIPYALPPVGDLRFKHPVPANPWNGVLNTTEFGFTCHQRNFKFFNDIPGFDRLLPTTPFNEDCLTLNVFVPVPFPQNATVMVYIHGGGYAIGGTSAKYYNGAYLAAEEDVIVVTMNYRLASLGFLYVEHPDMDANCGLMDQNLALKWVNENIGYFGGNPKDVTLFGQSAGGLSVGLHMISPMSQGLFKRAILQSGTPLADFLFQEKYENEGLAVQTGNQLFCAYNTGRDGLVECLKSTDPLELMNKEPKKKILPFIFKPVVDGKFLTENPIKTIRSGKFSNNFDIMTGTVKDEGTMFLSLSEALVFFPLVDNIDPHHEDFMNVVRFIIPNACEAFYKSVELMYTDWANFNKTFSNFRSANEFATDHFFQCPNEEYNLHYSSRGSKLYSYYLTYRAPAVDYVKWLGVPHTEELRYVMGEVTTSDIYSKEDKEFGFRLMRYWANFARTGSPNMSPMGLESYDWINWPRFNDHHEVLILAPKTNEVIIQHANKRCQFWRTVYPQFKALNENQMCPTS